MRHLPILRQGRPYYSVDRARAIHHRTKEPFVEISQANVGLIRRDFLQLEEIANMMSGFTTDEAPQTLRQGRRVVRQRYPAARRWHAVAR